MGGLFDMLFGARRKGSDGLLAAALKHYPASVPRHVGPAKHLDLHEAEDNLRQFLTNRDARLALLGSVLDDHGIDVAPILDPQADPRPAHAALSSWLAGALPSRDAMPGRSRTNAPIDDYVASDRRGDDILFSFVADLALLEGEGIVRRRSDWRWDLDRYPSDAGTYPYRRVVVSRDPGDRRPALMLDLEHETLEALYAMRGPGPQAGHPLGRSLAGVVAGAFDII